MRVYKKLVLLVLMACFILVIPYSKISAEELQNNEVLGVVTDADTNLNVTEIKTNEYDLTKSDNFKTYYVDVPRDESVVIPITIEKKGRLYYIYDYNNTDTSTKTYNCDVYMDVACSIEANYAVWDGYYGKLDVPKPGTYYIKFSVKDLSQQPDSTYYFNFSSYYINAEDQTLINDKQTISSFLSYDDPIYYKYTATKQGVIYLDVESSYGVNVTLCNSSKKAITEECKTRDSEHSFSFAVAKGTYYIKMTTASSYATILDSFKAVSSQAGTRKDKASTIKVNGTPKNVINLSSQKKGTAVWFKFNNTKNRKIALNILGEVTCGGLKIDFYDSKGTKWKSSYFYPVNNSNGGVSSFYYIGDDSKQILPKGTYYVKITKLSTKTNASYQVSVTSK